jgi:mannose-6-phosphate isomerase-like protein (cupin superfamily)
MMSSDSQTFSVSYAKDATYAPGLRDFLEYRDLGIAKATHGQFRAHVMRVKKDHTGDQDLHSTGLHQHLCTFQMIFVLKGWIRFVYEGQKGEFTFRAGDCVLQPAAIVHNELSCSDDLELLEVYSPAVHETHTI